MLSNSTTQPRTSAHPSATHGMTNSPEYRAWCQAKGRCSNPNLRNYHRYGGRGIRVCERWQSFEAFLEDMGFRPSGRHSLDRIDRDGDYTPENCQWATIRVQANNTCTNHFITYNGRTLTAAQWADETGIQAGTILNRVTVQNLPPAIALTVSPRDRRRMLGLLTEITHDGVTLSICGWAKRLGMCHGTIRLRLKRGWTVADALTEPLMKNQFG